MVYDLVTFNGEDELFEIRYHVLKDVVDEFRVIEFDETFSGKPKKQLFTKNWPKVKSYFITKETWSKYEKLARESPNTNYGKGALHWVTEFCQKESIKECLNDLQSDDIVFIGDVDEIWHPSLAIHEPKRVHKLGLLVYSYYLNNRSSEVFFGTIWTKYGTIKNKCLNHVRSMQSYYELLMDGGWHFTSMGGYDRVKQKLTDSYTQDSYANEQVMSGLQDAITNSRDFLGRRFVYTLDESQWPTYLKEHREKYKHLLYNHGKELDRGSHQAPRSIA